MAAARAGNAWQARRDGAEAGTQASGGAGAVGALGCLARATCGDLRAGVGVGASVARAARARTSTARARAGAARAGAGGGSLARCADAADARREVDAARLEALAVGDVGGCERARGELVIRGV